MFGLWRRPEDHKVGNVVHERFALKYLILRRELEELVNFETMFLLISYHLELEELVDCEGTCKYRY